MIKKVPKIVTKKYKGPQLRHEGGKLGEAPDADALFLQLRRLKSGDGTLYLDPDAEGIRKRRKGKNFEKMKKGGAVMPNRGGKFKGVF
jgi:hypothetical protein